VSGQKLPPGKAPFYRSQHELVFVYKKGTASHLNTFELGQHGRTRSNVWTYPGANSFRAGRMDELKMHPTVKPVALIADAMRDCSQRGSIILDAFAGSGTTIMAAEQIGRRAFCMEIDPLYVDAAVRRWQHATGKDAILESNGQTFDDLRAQTRPDVVAADCSGETDSARNAPNCQVASHGSGQRHRKDTKSRPPARPRANSY
jgi:hypothetical protein